MLGLLVVAIGMAQTAIAKLPSETVLLTFHDLVLVRDSKALWFDCTPTELRAQLAWMDARGAHYVSIDQVYRHLTRGEPLPTHPVGITFADNYEGFYRYAWPILRARHIPVAMFVHTDYVGDQHGRPKMTWAQLRELDGSGLVSVESQTRSHPADLRTLSDAQLSQEMVGSKASLEQHLGHPVEFLAYPNGKYDERVARAARDAHYLMAFTEVLKPAERAPNRWMVPRYVHTQFKRAFADVR